MEPEQKVLFEDYLILWRLSSLQHALIVSASNPVGIWKTTEGADFEINHPGMYYDCCGDEGRALATMRKRIELGEGDIRQHFRLHKNCLDLFLKMDGAIITDDREEFADSLTQVCENVFVYLDLARGHEERLKMDSFLAYPYCVPGHYFHILNHNKIGPCYFNKNHSYEGATTDLDNVLEKITDFKIRQEKLPYISLPLNEQSGAGFVDPDFKTHLIITKNLLGKVGLQLE